MQSALGKKVKRALTNVHASWCQECEKGSCDTSGMLRYPSPDPEVGADEDVKLVCPLLLGFSQHSLMAIVGRQAGTFFHQNVTQMADVLLLFALAGQRRQTLPQLNR